MFNDEISICNYDAATEIRSLIGTLSRRRANYLENQITEKTRSQRTGDMVLHGEGRKLREGQQYYNLFAHKI